MKMAYADPPYLGQGKKRYGQHHENASDYDTLVAHRALVERLISEYPDGWALSLSSPSLRTILNLLPEEYDHRIAAWVKPFCVFKKGVRPAYAWEPVLFHGGRNKNHPPPPKGGKATTPKDFVAANITLKTGLVGTKPPGFCNWVLDLLGLRPEDQFDDLFPGSGAVMDAWMRRRAA